MAQELPQPPGPPDITAKRAQFFGQQRQQGVQNARAQGQKMGDAINRRFAALGSTGSGAAIQAQMRNNEATQQAIQQAQNAPNAAELQALEGDANRAQQQAQFAENMAMQRRAQDIGAGQFDRSFGLQQQGQQNQVDQFGKTFGLQEGAQRFQQDLANRQFGLEQDKFGASQDQFNKQFGLTQEQFIQDQLDNQFNTLQNLYDRGIGVDIGKFLTNRYGAYGSNTDPLMRQLERLKRGGK